MQTRKAFIEKINNLGKRKTPFVLFVDFLTTEYYCYTLDEIKNKGIEIEFPDVSIRKLNVQAAKIPIKISVEKHNKKDYQTAFSLVKKNLNYGNSYLTNLTFSTHIKTENSLQEIFEAAKATYKINYKNQWICFSPETFIKIKKQANFFLSNERHH